MAESAKPDARKAIDPLRPSARRVALLLVGAVCCLLAFGAGFVGGLAPIFWRSYVRDLYIERALAQDPTIDFASSEWLENAMWSVPYDLPGQDLPGEAGEAVLVGLVLVPVVFVALHILSTWLAAGLALRADRRLDLGLGRRPALSLAAAVMVRVLFTRLMPWCLLCGVVAGLSYIGAVGQDSLGMLGLGWMPLTGVVLAVGAVLVIDFVSSVRAVRRRLQDVAPVDRRQCNGCGYSLAGLPREVEACPECGRTLVTNRTLVSMVMSPLAAHCVKWAAVTIVLLGLAGLAALMAYSPVARTVCISWVTVSPGPRGLGLGVVVAPDGAVVGVTDGMSTSYFSVRSVWEDRASWRWAYRTRAVEAGAVPGTWQKHELALAPGPWRALSIGAPPHALGIQPWPDAAYQAHVIPKVAMGALSVKFAAPEDLPPEYWAWLTEKLPDSKAAEPESETKPTE